MSEPIARDKVFYLGFQRVGTKTFGAFLERRGYKVASWRVSRRHGWSQKYLDGDLGGIVRSGAFQRHDAFEDGPWFWPPLAKYIYHEVPGSRFVLLTRPPEDWFKSMISHSGGMTLGEARMHCEVYDRLEDWYWLRENVGMPGDLRLSLFDKPHHYMGVYRKNVLTIKAFFERMPDADERFFCGDLYDPGVWDAVARFLGLPPVEEEKTPHTHRSRVRPRAVLGCVSRGQVYTKTLIQGHVAADVARAAEAAAQAEAASGQGDGEAPPSGVATAATRAAEAAATLQRLAGIIPAAG